MSEAPNENAKPLPLQMSLVPSPDGVSDGAIRGNMQQAGTNVGKYVRVWVQFPTDIDEDEVLLKLIVWFAPLYEGIP